MKKMECGTSREGHPKPSEVVVRGGAVMLYAHHAKPFVSVRSDRSDNDNNDDDENPRRPPR